MEFVIIPKPRVTAISPKHWRVEKFIVENKTHEVWAWSGEIIRRTNGYEALRCEMGSMDYLLRNAGSFEEFEDALRAVLR